MADDTEDVVESWEDVDTEVRKMVVTNLHSHLVTSIFTILSAPFVG